MGRQRPATGSPPPPVSWPGSPNTKNSSANSSLRHSRTADSSLHDVMARTERAVKEIGAKRAKMRARMEQLETQRHDRDEPEDKP